MNNIHIFVVCNLKFGIQRKRNLIAVVFKQINPIWDVFPLDGCPPVGVPRAIKQGFGGHGGHRGYVTHWQYRRIHDQTPTDNTKRHKGHCVSHKRRYTRLSCTTSIMTNLQLFCFWRTSILHSFLYIYFYISKELGSSLCLSTWH